MWWYMCNNVIWLNFFLITKNKVSKQSASLVSQYRYLDGKCDRLAIGKLISTIFLPHMNQINRSVGDVRSVGVLGHQQLAQIVRGGYDGHHRVRIEQGHGDVVEEHDVAQIVRLAVLHERRPEPVRERDIVEDRPDGEPRRDVHQEEVMRSRIIRHADHVEDLVEIR